MEITALEYEEARAKYYRILATWSEEYPTFERFLSPDNVSCFQNSHSNRDYFELSITGKRRWEIMQSPHVEALLKAWLCDLD